MQTRVRSFAFHLCDPNKEWVSVLGSLYPRVEPVLRCKFQVDYIFKICDFNGSKQSIRLCQSMFGFTIVVKLVLVVNMKMV